MFGLMEITAQLDEATKLAIIPTVVLPFTILGMILTSVATWVAAFFGVELKAEGPKKLFEVLMKPKVLLWALVSNAVVYGAIKGGEYLYNGPYPLWWVEMQNSNVQSSTLEYPGVETPSATLRPLPDSVTTLEVVWENRTKSLIFGSPVVSGSSLFTGEDAGRILEFDLKTGQLRRRFEIGKPVMASPLVWNGKIFVGEGIHTTHHARLYSFDLKSGSFVKSFETQGHIERAATFAKAGDRPLLLTPAGKDGLYAVNPDTMEKVWQASVGHIDSFPAADGERVYVGTGLEMGFEETPTKVYALDIHTGKVVWEKSLPTSVWGVPALWNHVVCFPAGDVYKNTHYGQITCYDRKNGEEYFAFNTTGALISQPVIIDDSLLIADFYGKIYQFNLKNKSLEWTLTVPVKSINYASVVVDAQDRVILPGLEGLYVFSRKTQKPLFTWKPEEAWKGTFTNVVFYEDLWIIADRSGTLRALRGK